MNILGLVGARKTPGLVGTGYHARDGVSRRYGWWEGGKEREALRHG